MPFISATNNVRLFYRLEGRAELPVLVLSHSLGCDHSMWDPQMPAFLEHFRVLRYDTRGHGASDVPAGEYSIDQLGEDARALIAVLKIDSFAWCGLSMGGAIGQWLELHAPQGMKALVLANTSPQFGTRETWEARLEAVRRAGMPGVEQTAMQRFFSAANQTSTYAESTRQVLLGTDPRGYAGCCAALRDVNFKSDVRRINLPVLVIGSDRDPSTPWEGNGDFLAREIPGAKSVVLPGAHLSNLEQPQSFKTAVLEFLLDRDEAGDSLQTGMSVRRQVLGDQYVERSFASATDFNRDFQTLITRYIWGGVWSRPGLEHRTRRMLVLAVTSAMGRWEEFRLHVRAAFSHGMEACDVKELLLQVAAYAGAPAANTGFQIAREELEKLSS